MKEHEHEYMQGPIGDECEHCGLLKSTIEMIKAEEIKQFPKDEDLKEIVFKLEELLLLIKKKIKNNEDTH